MSNKSDPPKRPKMREMREPFRWPGESKEAYEERLCDLYQRHVHEYQRELQTYYLARQAQGIHGLDKEDQFAADLPRYVITTAVILFHLGPILWMIVDREQAFSMISERWLGAYGEPDSLGSALASGLVASLLVYLVLFAFGFPILIYALFKMFAS